MLFNPMFSPTDFAIVVKLTLSVHYPEGYPDILPELSLDAIDGELEDEEKQKLIEELKAVVCASVIIFYVISN